MESIDIRTSRRNEMIDVTDRVSQAVQKAGITNGLVTLWVPHTTAGVTINENADPDVTHDILLTLDELIPHRRSGYRHGEGNSDAHVKSSLVGASLTLIVEEGRLCLGTWQGVYFCEFDGPRSRKLWLRIGQ